MRSTSFGFDFINHKLNLLHINDGNLIAAEAVSIPFAEYLKPTASGFSEVIETHLREHLKQHPSEAVYGVFPSELVGMDIITLPSIAKNKLSEAYKTELSSLYKKQSELYFIEQPFFANKLHNATSVTFFSREILQKMVSTCSMFKLPLKGLTFSAASVANAALSFNDRIKKLSVLAVNIGKDKTVSAFLSKGKLCGLDVFAQGTAEIDSFTEADKKILCFQPVLRRIMALAALNQTRSELPSFDEVLISIPHDFRFLLPLEGDSTFKIKEFGGSEPLQGSMDLYGCTVMGFNRQFMFV